MKLGDLEFKQVWDRLEAANFRIDQISSADLELLINYYSKDAMNSSRTADRAFIFSSERNSRENIRISRTAISIAVLLGVLQLVVAIISLCRSK